MLYTLASFQVNGVGLESGIFVCLFFYSGTTMSHHEKGILFPSQMDPNIISLALGRSRT